jgi:hypothetical protein
VSAAAFLSPCLNCCAPAAPLFINGGGWMDLCDQCAKAAESAFKNGVAIMAVYRPRDDAVAVFVEGGAVTLSRDEATRMRDALSGALAMRERAEAMASPPIEVRV